MEETTTKTRQNTRGEWSVRKKDDAPRGVYRQGRVWAIRFVCGAGHIHRQKVGTLKGDAVRAYHDRKGRTNREPGWCPGVEARQKRAKAKAEEQARITFEDYAEEYKEWRRGVCQRL